MPKFILLFASVNGALAVILGAFGAHGLKGHISDALFSAFKTASYYHLFHVLALIMIALLMLQLKNVGRGLTLTAYCWMLGIVLFSGSLYGLALGAPSWFGPVTPIGGVLFIGGWLCLVLTIAKASLPRSDT